MVVNFDLPTLGPRMQGCLWTILRFIGIPDPKDVSCHHGGDDCGDDCILGQVGRSN